MHETASKAATQAESDQHEAPSRKEYLSRSPAQLPLWTNAVTPLPSPQIQFKLKVNASGDKYEQEADRIADQLVGPASQQGPGGEPPISRAGPTTVQRQEKGKPGAVLSEGAALTYEQLLKQPGYVGWEKRQIEMFKLKLWTQQPTELKAGIIGFGLLNLGLLGTLFGVDEKFRTNTVDTLQDTNLQLPLRLLPYTEYFPVSSFKYTLPTAGHAPYKFETEFSFDAWFKLMQDKWRTPEIGLSLGVDSAYTKEQGFSPLTGGNIKLQFGGGIINLSGFYNQALPPTPMLISDPTSGQPPVWIMRSLPGQLEENLPKGSGVFLTVDILRLPELFNPPASQQTTIQRKENSGSDAGAVDAPPSVQRALSSSPGEPLDAGTRRVMEGHFDQDFSQVRIHTGSQASQSAESINARAYTSRNHIVFGPGEYQPETTSGQKLLAHELVHIVQQNGAVQRKETQGNPSLTADLRAKLEAGRYGTALLRLNDSLDWGTTEKKKKWLAENPEIRRLFLAHLPATMIAEVYSLEELLQFTPQRAFEIIDCWYQAEQEKQTLYLANIRLFDHLLAAISPYTGIDIAVTVENLTRAVEKKPHYVSDKDNPEFLTINLLAPGVERKIKFYNQYKRLFKAVKKKFDPYTGLSLATMETLTDTNEVDREQALKIYDKLKHAGEEQRRAFLETALFAGGLEADKDAQKYYKKKYKKQYKALPHNWDFAFFPWNWGEAPFADRLTADHIALMSSALFYEDLERRKFGFDKGINDKAGEAEAKKVSDAVRLIEELQSDKNFYHPRRLAILLSIAVRGGLENEVTHKVLVPKNAEKELTGEILAVVERYGFIASDRFRYQDDQTKVAEHDKNRTWYIIKRTLFKWDSGSVVGEQRGTFDLRRLQDTKDHPGSLGGLRFGSTVYQGDDDYNSRWLDEAVQAHPGSSTLLPNLRETTGKDRRGQIFASIRNDIRQANIFASTLPIEGLNFFSGGTLYRAGTGVIQGLELHLSWTKDTSEPDNSIQLQLDIGNLLLNQFEMVAPTSTLTLGQIGVKGFRVRLSLGNLAAAGGLFIGLLKNADFMLNALIDLLPNVLKLLPYAVMTMVEEFKGTKEHEYKDALGEVLKNDFSALDASVTFTSLKVRNMYDTAAGFLDDITIEKLGKDGQPVRQGLRVQENKFWTTDALFHLREKIRLINEQIRAEKANVVGTDHADKMKALETEKAKLLKVAAEKSLQHENRDQEVERLREIYSELRELEQQLAALFNQAVRENHPLYDPLTFRVLEEQRKHLNSDLEYIDNIYFDDKKLVEQSSDPIKRFEARRRMQAFEARYKSVDVRMRLRGLTLHGGSYVRDLVNDALKSVGFIEPQLEGIENINISALDSSFTASGMGPARLQDETGVGIRNLHLPLIKAPAIAFKSDKMLIEAGQPLLENVYLSVSIDFVKNPLAKDPAQPYSYQLQKLYVSKATLNGLTVKVGSAEPLLDFPAEVPVELWGLRLWDYDPKLGKINLKIQDVKAQGVYADTDEEKGSSTTVAFGIDTTAEGKPRWQKPAALDLRYDPEEDSITTTLNIRSAWIPSLALQSPTLSITSAEETRAVQLDDVQASVKVTRGQEKSGDTPATPTVVDIHDLHIGRVAAQGITLTMKEEAPEEGEQAKAKDNTVQVVTLPKEDEVFIENVNVKGLRLTLSEQATQLSTIEKDASVQLGKGDLGGIGYQEKSARGSVLQALTVHKNQFDALTLEALNRGGRLYSLKEFLKFFGRTRLAGADIEAGYQQGKNQGTLAVKGKENLPITIDYVRSEEGKPDYYKVRLPLKHIKVPALHIEKGAHIIDIPRAKTGSSTSVLRDVDVKLRAYVEIGEEETKYDVYLDSLDIAQAKIFGLQYHNKEKGIDVEFDPRTPLYIPNVKAGGFRFSSQKALDVFGKEGGWIKAAAEENQLISAHFERISAALTDGTFLAEKDSAAGRSALDVDIASFGFTYDKAGNMTVTLGKITGGFPKMTITQTDPATGERTTTAVSSAGKKAVAAESVDITIGADKNTVIDAQGLSAGDLTLTRTATLGKETSTTKVNLKPEALGAKSALVKLNADNSQEITLSGIRGGKINIDLVSSGAKGKSENYITLPDPDAIEIEQLKILVDVDGRKRITVVKPTIKNVTLRHPSQSVAGDYIKIVGDLAVKGNIELGDGNFDTLTFAGPYDAFVGIIEDQVPVELKNLHLEIQDSSKSVPEKDPPKQPLTADQEKLIDLEKVRDAAHSEMINTPAEFHHGDHSVENPEFWKAVERYHAAKKAYDDHRAKMVGSAKAAAQASMTKKYLDAVSGTVTGSLRIFDSEIPLRIETYQGAKYVEISQEVADNLKSLIRSLIGTTVDMPFWSSAEMKAIGKGLKRWYRFFSPTATADIDGIASGRANAVVSLLLRDILIWPGVLETDKSMYGINLNLEGYWALDATSYDSIGIGLCELQYKHPAKDNFYNLYGIIEHLQYVSPALASASGQADTARLEELARGVHKSEEQVSDMDIAAAVNELVLFIKYNLAREAERLKNTIIRNIKGVNVKADVSLRPQEVINLLLKEHKAGTLTFDKGKDSIDNIHIEGDYKNKGIPQATGTIGGGAKGTENILIPGATYVAQDKAAKVTYDALEISPLSLAYEQNVYQLENSSAKLKGLKFGIRK